jgi:hypothetical protein
VGESDNEADVNHWCKVVLWTPGRIDDLVAAGAPTSGPRETTPRGVAAYDQLCATGFRATREEVRAAVAEYQGEDPDDLFVEMVYRPDADAYRAGKEKTGG